jgi:hypothetical protein
MGNEIKGRKTGYLTGPHGNRDYSSYYLVDEITRGQGNRVTGIVLTEESYEAHVSGLFKSRKSRRKLQISYEGNSSWRDLGILALVGSSVIAGATIIPELWEIIKWLAQPAQKGEMARIFAQSLIGFGLLSLSLDFPKGIEKKNVASLISALAMTIGAESFNIPKASFLLLIASVGLPFLKTISRIKR